MLNTYNEYNVIQPRELKNAAIVVLLTLDVMLMERSSTQNLISAKKTISITLQKCKLTPGWNVDTLSSLPNKYLHGAV